jgi:hypothetical protein
MTLAFASCLISFEERKVQPWRPLGLWDVEAPTFSRQLAHRWRWSCQPAITATKIPGTNFSSKLSLPQGYNATERIRTIEESSGFIGNRISYLPACCVVPQPTTIPRLWMKHDKLYVSWEILSDEKVWYIAHWLILSFINLLYQEKQRQWRKLNVHEYRCT